MRNLEVNLQSNNNTRGKSDAKFEFEYLFWFGLEIEIEVLNGADFNVRNFPGEKSGTRKTPAWVLMRKDVRVDSG